MFSIIKRFAVWFLLGGVALAATNAVVTPTQEVQAFETVGIGYLVTDGQKIRQNLDKLTRSVASYQEGSTTVEYISQKFRGDTREAHLFFVINESHMPLLEPYLEDLPVHGMLIFTTEETVAYREARLIQMMGEAGFTNYTIMYD